MLDLDQNRSSWKRAISARSDAANHFNGGVFSVAKFASRSSRSLRKRASFSALARSASSELVGVNAHSRALTTILNASPGRAMTLDELTREKSLTSPFWFSRSPAATPAERIATRERLRAAYTAAVTAGEAGRDLKMSNGFALLIFSLPVVLRRSAH